MNLAHQIRCYQFYSQFCSCKLEFKRHATCFFLEKMVQQWLNIFEGVPGAFRSGDGSGISNQITRTMELISSKYLGAAEPFFVAFGVTCTAIVGAYTAWELSKGLVSYVLAEPLNLGQNPRKFGAWAGICCLMILPCFCGDEFIKYSGHGSEYRNRENLRFRGQ